ncbi:heparinase II/III domain-containing protein [Paenibacillus ferrarius]|uniref:heparinase II/III domain-containing protein n=1 Tax=Paenibacillus ferrarius TaxID=1469647 RepID=UPI003D2A72DA
MHKKRLEQFRLNFSSPVFLAAAQRLKRDAAEAARITYEIHAGELGQWTHFYHCADDGTRLTFRWEKPFAHACPTCGKVYTGEPYDDAWTSLVHVEIGKAVAHLGLLYVAQPERTILAWLKDKLTAYADHYETYQVHGDIPYNGPGRLFAQTLDEAHWITDLALGFAVIQEHLTQEEAQHIQQGLLEPCARFLISYKEEQIHNHAVLITSAIGMLGILLENEEIILAGLDGEYGLLDQLNRGVLEDGLWYEGNVQYHFYAFQSLLHFAMLAEGTPWDIWPNQAVKAMFDYPPYMLLPSGAMPTLNDTGPYSHIGTYAPNYEIAYAIYGDELYRSYLLTTYGLTGAVKANAWATRDSIYALMYGQNLSSGRNTKESVDLIAEMQTTQSFIGSGLTKMTNNAGWHVLIKHSRFGGEHDHMDRLGLSIVCGKTPLLTDPGTTAYGIPAHYGWFKHTLAHNTVSIAGKDQPPRDGELVQLRTEPWGYWVESAVDWCGDDYRMKGRIILPEELKPWSQEAYEGVRIRRITLLADTHLLDVVEVQVPSLREVLLANHFSGRLVDDEGWETTTVAIGERDQQWLKEKRRLAGRKGNLLFAMAEGYLQQLSWCSETSEVISALTPDNPPSSSRTSLFERVMATDRVWFVQALRYDRNELIAEGILTVECETDRVWHISLDLPDGKALYRLDWRGEKAALTWIPE